MSFGHILFLSILLFEYGNSGDILRSGDRWVSVKGGTLVSSKGTFEAGFFRAAGTESWFLGIWYKNVAERSYVWVGNREEEPLHSSNGTLEVVDDQLVIRDNSKPVWFATRRRESSSSSTTTAVAQLLENGNLVLKDVNNDNPEDFFWQSFDEPTDTILPEMKLVWNYQNWYLTSWRAFDDPRPGNFFFGFITPQLEWKNQHISYLLINTTTTSPDYTRVQLDNDGSVRHYTWNQRVKKWDQQWSLSPDQCELHRTCYGNAYCRVGFEFSSMNVTTKECVQKKNWTCNGDDHFSLVRKMNIPDSRNAKSNPSITKPEQCGKICLGDCTCTAYSMSISLETDNWSCITWSGDLLDLR
uniref:Bulb-type lectin domain-containing protein n=1 Tax=Brassica campestris TaxID=3711 RepID=A0A3P5YDK4_BRACM|nr:unnamed protein product [Brassica rapa]